MIDRARAQLDRERGNVVFAEAPVRSVAGGRVELRRLLRDVVLAVHLLDLFRHGLRQSAQQIAVLRVGDRVGRMAPGVQDQLRIAVIGDQADEPLACDQVADGLALRL